MTNTQKIQSEIDELHKKFDVLQSQSATLSELNSVRRRNPTAKVVGVNGVFK